MDTCDLQSATITAGSVKSSGQECPLYTKTRSRGLAGIGGAIDQFGAGPGVADAVDYRDCG